MTRPITAATHCRRCAAVVILGLASMAEPVGWGPTTQACASSRSTLPQLKKTRSSASFACLVRCLGTLSAARRLTQALQTRLSEAGFEADAPAFFVWGESPCISTPRQSMRPSDYIGRGTAPGSSIIFDYVPVGVIDGTSTEPPTVRARRLEMLERFGEPWLFGIPDGGIGDLVGKHGLELLSNLRIRELWDTYLRAGTADAVLGDADPEGGVALARVPR